MEALDREGLPAGYCPDEEATDLLLRAETLIPGALAGNASDAAWALLRTAERCFVLSTGLPRPKRGIASWSGLLSRMGLALTPSEAASLDAAMAGDTPVPAALTERVARALPGLLVLGGLSGVEPPPPTRRLSPLPPIVLSEVRDALLSEGFPAGEVFGSWAREEEREGSDIDVLVAGPESYSLSHGRVHLHVASPGDRAALRGVAVQGAWRDGILVLASATGNPLDSRRAARRNKDGGEMGELFESVGAVRTRKAAEAERQGQRQARMDRLAAEAAERIQTAGSEFAAKAVELGIPFSRTDHWEPFTTRFWVHPDRTPSVWLDGERPVDAEGVRQVVSRLPYEKIETIAEGVLRSMARLLEAGPR